MAFISVHFPAFLVVGGIGFLIDSAALMILIEFGGLDPYTARVYSFGVAVTATWQLNRHWTFRSNKTHRPVKEYVVYTSVQVFGALVNLAIYSICILKNEFFASYPVIALAIGSIVAMFFNFTGSHYIVFRHHIEGAHNKIGPE